MRKQRSKEKVVEFGFPNNFLKQKHMQNWSTWKRSQLHLRKQNKCKCSLLNSNIFNTFYPCKVRQILELSRTLVAVNNTWIKISFPYQSTFFSRKHAKACVFVYQSTFGIYLNRATQIKEKEDAVKTKEYLTHKYKQK
jgi:hypothetical protein